MSQEGLTAKQKIGDQANKWLEKNRSLVLRQTPRWAQSMAVTMISLSSILLIGSIIFKIDEVITVQGQLKSIGGNIDVKTPAAGKISEVFFEDGALVKKGDKLIKFDTTDAAQKKLTYSNLLKLETDTFLSYKSQYQSELRSLNRNLDVLTKRYDTQNYIIKEMDLLVREGGFQKLQYLQQKDQLFELETQINEIIEQKNKLKISLEQRQIEFNKTKDKITSELASINLQLKYQNVTAPSTGIIFDPQVYEGAVLQPGQVIVSIVPQQGLSAEVLVPNKEIGFVAPGQSVKVRVDAFPYTRYGEIDGKIIQIGADALPPNPNHSFYRFPVKVKLDRSYLVSNDTKIPLKSGMSITTNIKLRDKRAISLVSDLFVDQTDSLRYLRQQ